jgi:hypothetical protein
MCGHAGIGLGSIGGGMIEAVHYRHAPSCRVDRSSARLPAFALSCPRVSYVPATPRLTDPPGGHPDPRPRDQRQRLLPGPRRRADQRIRTRTGDTTHALSPLLEPDERSPGDVTHGTLVIFSWTACQPVTSSRSNYTFFLNDGRCGGQGGTRTDESPPMSASPAP